MSKANRDILIIMKFFELKLLYLYKEYRVPTINGIILANFVLISMNWKKLFKDNFNPP